MDQSCDDIDLVAALVQELRHIEDTRLEIMKDLLGICGSMHGVQVKLADGMMQMLLEEKWREGEVSKLLAVAQVNLIRAVTAIEKGSPHAREAQARRCSDAAAWTEEVPTS